MQTLSLAVLVLILALLASLLVAMFGIYVVGGIAVIGAFIIPCALAMDRGGPAATRSKPSDDWKWTCPACGYDLRGLDDATICPECGR